MLKLLILFFFVGIVAGQFVTDRVDPNGLSHLVFFSNRWTTSLRGQSIPQLNCVGGSAHHLCSYVHEVRCKNVGYGPVWNCETYSPGEYRLGTINVNCEGYDHPHDHYILRGSCGLEFTLERVYTLEDNWLFIFLLALIIVGGVYACFQI